MKETQPVYSGPTVAEYARARIRELDRQIAELQAERKNALIRMQRYAHSTVTEAERVATGAEPYQTGSLPD